MVINLGTAVDPTVVSVLLVHGTETARVASLSGACPRCDDTLVGNRGHQVVLSIGISREWGICSGMDLYYNRQCFI